MSRIYTDLHVVPFQRELEQPYKKGFDATKDEYAFRITEHLRRLIDATNNEGLKKQFLPQTNELDKSATEFYDVTDEPNFRPVPGIVHRYPTKVLLMLTLNCPAYCRFCFRKEELNDPPYGRFLSQTQIDQALAYISDEKIEEVIFSGGDPFFCSDDLLDRVVSRLVDIPTVRLVRYHTRLFTFDPERITDNLVAIVRKKPTAFMVLHVNQVEEITPEMEQAIARCVDNGIPLFTQTALLKGVNDSYEALAHLFTKLVQLRVKPYYLFHTDPGHGLGHFRVKLEDGIKLYRSLYNRVSGLATPIYLFNVPGGHGHVILDLGNIKSLGDERYELTTWKGDKVIYHDF